MCLMLFFAETKISPLIVESHIYFFLERAHGCCGIRETHHFLYFALLPSSCGLLKIADQRTARFPVTFALHIVLLLEHNRCCVEVAPGLGYEGDEVSAVVGIRVRQENTGFAPR